MMAKIKMIATDIDGTLLDNEGNLSEENLNHIKSFTQDGIEVVLVTSRPVTRLPKELITLKELTYIIASNGALIKNREKNETIHKAHIQKEDGIQIINHLKDVSSILTVVIDEQSYTTYESFNAIIDSYGEDKEWMSNYFHNHRCMISLDGLNTKIKNCVAIEKIHLNFSDPLQQIQILNLIGTYEDIDKFHITSSANTNIEITHKLASKAQGVLSLAKHLKVTPDQVIVIGDGENDTSMFSITPYSVAMKNASENVKRQAMITSTYTNNESGWSKVIKEIINEG